MAYRTLCGLVGCIVVSLPLQSGLDAIAQITSPDSPPNNQREEADIAPPLTPIPVEVVPSDVPRTIIPEGGAERPYAYTLGAGDQIQIDIFNVPEFSGGNGTYSIPLDGVIQLPWVGAVSLSGLTIDEATQLLTDRYALYVNSPCADAPVCPIQLLTIKLLQPRPMRVNVTGEVNRPGVYVVGNPGGGFNSQEQTVSSAIQLAGGITQLADVRQIAVYRPQQVGDDVIFPVDFWTLLQDGALEQDLVLRDGDRIVVPLTTVIDEAEITEISTANISPETIQVNVVGEVDAPGLVDLPPNSSMNQAILAAGGLNRPRAKGSRIEFIRLNPDGTIINRTISLELEDSVNPDTNPALRNNDIIVVNRTALARITDLLNTVTAPIGNVLGLVGL
ncbi:MAG: polysaccharide biosynthesis/export family protein [Leptolyngbyaceae cyanobacterium]